MYGPLSNGPLRRTFEAEASFAEPPTPSRPLAAFCAASRCGSLFKPGATPLPLPLACARAAEIGNDSSLKMSSTGVRIAASGSLAMVAIGRERGEPPTAR